MNDLINSFSFFICGAAVVLSVVGLWFTAIMPGIDNWEKRFFLSFFSVLILVCILAIIEIILVKKFIFGTAMNLVLVFETFFMSLPLPMLTYYLVHCCGEDIRSSKLIHTVLGLYAVFFIILLIGAIIRDTPPYTQDMQYNRSSWYPFLLLPMVVTMLLNIISTLQHRNRLPRSTFFRLLFAMLPMAIALGFQMFIDVIPLVDIAYVLSAISMYSLNLSEQIDQNLRHQREIAQNQLEIANQRVSIMVLQMRPHFIYNTMTAIYCLCDQDPGKARRVIMDFTTYLRKNFTAIASASPIPFSSELEHTRAYLAVEQAQYEDSLFVEYDTPHSRFRVPPLTLQPIVENAIKHGRDPYKGPFHINIRTRKTDSGSEIVVADNGRGFDTGGGGDLHIALKNIRERLEMMCGGSLVITPNDGGGTKVTVTIPDNNAK